MTCTGFIAMIALDHIGTGYVEFNRATAFPRASLEALRRALWVRSVQAVFIAHLLWMTQWLGKNMRVMQKKPVDGAASDYSRSACVHVAVWMTYQLWTQTWVDGNTVTRLNVVSRPDVQTRCVIVLQHNSPPHDYSTVQNTLDYMC
jgi:hypothetical protein